MGTIFVTGIQVYAYHGCIPEEAVVGGRFCVDVELDADLSEAGVSDDLNHTIDYVQVTDIVNREMAIRSNLIEHVAHRMLQALRSAFPATSEVRLKV
ncbi:MAG: dihydroneopterin aldolase, partial [Bacteroidota bacterium]